MKDEEGSGDGMQEDSTLNENRLGERPPYDATIVWTLADFFTRAQLCVPRTFVGWYSRHSVTDTTRTSLFLRGWGNQQLVPCTKLCVDPVYQSVSRRAVAVQAS